MLKQYLLNSVLPQNAEDISLVVAESRFHYINAKNELCFAKVNQNKLTNSVFASYECKIIPKSFAPEV